MKDSRNKSDLQELKSQAEASFREHQTEVFSLVGGVVAFGSALALSTWAQGRILGISTGTPGPTPTLAGLATVCLASLASHHAALFIGEQYPYYQLQLSNRLAPRWSQAEWLRREERHHYTPPPPRHHFTTLRICTLGLVAFKLLGGRFWAIAPSSFTHLGSYARSSLPATEYYATAAQRARLERLGRVFGCHTCGSRRLWSSRQAATNFVGDHMPPKAVAEQLNKRWYRRWLGRKVQFRFYPQCVPCSNKQGGILSKATAELRLRRSSSFPFKRGRIPNLGQAGGGRNAYVHSGQFRVNHLTGGAVASVAMGLVQDPIPSDWTSRNAHVRLQQRFREGRELLTNTLSQWRRP